MPRKKKPTEGLDSRGQDGEEEEEEKRALLNAKKKRSFVDAFIVISDSDGEQESKEESGLQIKRTKQQLDRTKFAAKRKIAQMTEEEQFALALKMSEQEARQVNCQEEEEEELLRKAIAESLSSCQPSESSDATPELPAEAVGKTGPNDLAEQEGSEILGGLALCPDTPRSECSSHSQSARADGNGQMDVARSPLVVLRRLSQEIVENSLVSSIIVSRGKGQPLPRSSEKPSSPARRDSDSLLPSAFGEDLFSLSPTFGRIAPGSWRLTPRRLFTSPRSPSKAEEHEAKEQLLPGTCSSVGAASAESPAALCNTWTTDSCDSPERSCRGASTKHTRQPGHGTKVCVSTEQSEQNKGPGSAPELCVLRGPEEGRSKEEARDTVHYYWGIPFCPKGVDPNQYTKVILCQLEVYQKSLKQAQRQLLHKKEFGNPVVPSPSSLSQNELGKGDQISRENGLADDTEDGDPEVQKESESITWLLPLKRREAEDSPGQNMEEEKNSASDDEPTTSYCQASQVLAAVDMPEDGEPMQITQSISALTSLGSRRSPNTATENSAEEEVSVCPETQPSPSEEEPEREELGLDSKDASMQAGGDENASRAVPEGSPAAAGRVSCPLCERRFPATEIELHAMYCNGAGEEAAHDSPVLTRRQREARSRAAGSESGPASSGTDKCEKCYLCKSLVPLLQYQRHVDNCLQAARQAQGTRRLRSAKDGRHEGRLLSMLELSESRSAGADAGTPFSGLRDQQSPPAFPGRAEDDAGDSPGSLSCASFSISPAKSHVSVAEAAGCVLDLEPHVALRLGSRQQTKACRRSKRKF
ncbi:PREDICTED: BRCA1-A complex subunit RAP80 [Tinamus guttatus]|uniref:BRCA1-A complex subunit RAP80 n=1 Tax=Tinamus guttatus TaxID=94827 RepID=UPI00052ED9BF|nr:PREDICTED: BRCA1-A complex subunit RAP80 [Tinamus guttatus]